MKNITVTPYMLESHLRTLDNAYDVATKLYSKLINDADFNNDWETIREICDTSLKTLEAIDKARFETQTQIIMTLREDTSFNEYNYNRSVDSQADEVDALNSVFGGDAYK